MIEILLLSGTFFIILLLGVITIVVQFKNWAHNRDEEHKKRIEELAKRIDETQDLFRQEVSEILHNFKNLLK